jgi:nicotinate-nucleotide pyrophosphorylase (carboxylating)
VNRSEHAAPDPTRWLDPPRHVVVDAVARALAEDLAPLGDLTSSLLPPIAAEAHFRARDDGRLAGTACATEAFLQVDPGVDVAWTSSDGDSLEAGQVLGTVSGSLASLLTAERTALNFLGHLSGIATLTAEFVAEAARGGTARVWDTRKTVPGMRALAKAAVRAGGGRNHRGNLSDWLLIKDNHLGGIAITEAVGVARDRWPGRTVHVECDSIPQCIEALDVGADAILLDNMSPDDVTACVRAARERQGDLPRRTLLEVSGGVTLETIAAYSATGVDMISVGAITNSAPVLDLGLDLD